VHQNSSGAYTGNIRGCIRASKKQLIGPKQSKTAPLKTKSGKNIKEKQMKRWVEHSNLYARESTSRTSRQRFPLVARAYHYNNASKLSYLPTEESCCKDA